MAGRAENIEQFRLIRQANPEADQTALFAIDTAAHMFEQAGVVIP